MQAAIITPARLDLDSRTSSVIIALPAPSAISSASWSRPASRHAADGFLRKRARKAGSVSSRSMSLAATSVSLLVVRSVIDRPWSPRLSGASLHYERLAKRHEDRNEKHQPDAPQHDVDDGLGRQVDHDLLVAQRHADREQRADDRPADAGDRVAPQRHAVGLALVARHAPLELRLGALLEAGLAQHVDQDVVAVAIQERVEVEQPADVGRE